MLSSPAQNKTAKIQPTIQTRAQRQRNIKSNPNPPTIDEIATSIRDLTALLANLSTTVTNMAAGPVQNQIIAPNIVAATQFALSPGLAAGNDLIDY